MLTHDNIKLSSVVAALYGLTADNANVDKALARTMQGGLLNALLTEFTKTSDSGDILATDSLLNALNKLNNQINSKINTGTYTGDEAVTREINIGFAPILVVISSTARFSVFSFKTKLAKFNVSGQGAATVSEYDLYKCTNIGFKVGTGDYAYQSNYNTNQSGGLYEYIAFA